ncbi:VCBS [Moritella sp. PE36]|uniref:hypothetical protein n=1 Tax=Moritella sp. PE36 TaxID=58051 RepID=UPI00015693D8|nr:hypothetical protein [Moritella sp. PE36]EDM66191.1 VCBS [Moritella sp. PE36]
MTGVEVALLISILSVGVSLYTASQIETDNEDNGAQIGKSGTSGSRQPCYGMVRTGGLPVYSNVQNNDSSQLLNVFACGVGVTNILQVYIDDVAVLGFQSRYRETPTGGNNQLRFSGNNLINGFEKQCEVQIRSGLDTGIPMQLAIDYGDGEWSALMRGDRVCCVAIKSERIVDDEGIRILSDSFSVSLLVEGLPVYDPRYHSTGEKEYIHSDPSVPVTARECGRNPALAILDYMVDPYFGMGLSSDYIDYNSIIAAANYCDANKLYIDAVVDSSSDFATALDNMCKCADLALFIENGSIVLRFQDVAMPSFDFDENNILNSGGVKITEQNSSNYYNCVEVEFKNTLLHDAQDTFTIPENVINDPLVIQNGFINAQTLSMPFTRYNGNNRNDSDSPMKFLANRILRANEFQKQVEIDIDLMEYPVRIYDVITITENNIGWNKKEFRVTSIKSSISDDQLNIATINCIEYSDSVYTGIKNGGGGGQPLPIQPVVSPPTNLVFTQHILTDTASATLTWSRTFYASDSVFDVQYKSDASSAWTPLGRTDKLFWDFPRLYPDVYDFRVRTVSAVNGTSNWTVLEDQEVSQSATLPPVTGLKCDTTTQDFKWSWDDMLDSAVAVPDPTNPNNPTNPTVRDFFSHYELNIFQGDDVSTPAIFQAATNEFNYTYPTNVDNNLNRKIRAHVYIVSKDGTRSQLGAANLQVTNDQCFAPGGVDIYGKIGAIWFEFAPNIESDFRGTEVHISTTPNFIPSDATLATLLGNETLHVWYFPDGTPDNDLRYVTMGHYDFFGRDNINYAPEETVLYNPAAAAVTMNIQSDAQAFKYDSDSNLIEPTEIVFNALKQNIDRPVTWTVIPDVIGAPVVGDDFTLSSTQFGAESSVAVTATMTTNTHGTFTDTITILRLQDGGNGAGAFTLENIANTSIGTNSVTSTGGVNGVYDSGAVAVEYYGSEFSFSGRFIHNPNDISVFGARRLITGGTPLPQFDYAIQRGGSDVIRVYENGTQIGSGYGSADNTDVFAVARIGNNISYRRNGDEFLTTAIPPSEQDFAFAFGVGFQHTGTTFNAIAISTGIAGGNGENSLVAALSNDAHSVPADSGGVVPVDVYNGSGTTVRAFDGVTELQYGNGTDVGTYTVSANATSITAGTPTLTGLFVTYGNASGFVAGTSVLGATIDFTVSGLTLTGAPFSFVKRQSFTKSLGGVGGDDGNRGAGQFTVSDYPNVWNPNFPAVGTGSQEMLQACINATTNRTPSPDDAVTIFGDNHVTELPISVRFTGGTPTDLANWNRYEVVINGDLLVDGTVTADHIAANTITADQIEAGAIKTDELDALSVTAEKIAVGTITADQIYANTITGNEISSATTIVAGSGNASVTLDGVSADRIYAGHVNAASAPFRVDQLGRLYASNAYITGEINATYGTITGDLTIGRNTSVSNFVRFNGGSNAGSTAPFMQVQDGGYNRVQWGYDGRLRMYNQAGTDTVLDFNPAANTYIFKGTVQADRIDGDVVSARTYTTSSIFDIPTGAWFVVLTFNVVSPSIKNRNIFLSNSINMKSVSGSPPGNISRIRIVRVRDGMQMSYVATPAGSGTSGTLGFQLPSFQLAANTIESYQIQVGQVDSYFTGTGCSASPVKVDLIPETSVLS